MGSLPARRTFNWRIDARTRADSVPLEDLSGVAENGICLFAEEPGAVADVTLRRVTLEFRAGPLFEVLGGNLDLRPAADHAIAIHVGGTAPVWAHRIQGVRLEDFRAVISPSAEGIFRPGVRQHDGTLESLPFQ